MAQELGSATVFQADKHKLNEACPSPLLNAQGNSVAQLRRAIYRPGKQKQAQQKDILCVKDGFHLCLWKISLSPEASHPKEPRSTHPAHSTSMSDPGGENQSRAPLPTSKTHLPKEQKHFQAPAYPENTEPGCSRHPVCSAGEQSQGSAEEARPDGVCSI